jgi:hypothetical protein
VPIKSFPRVFRSSGQRAGFGDGFCGVLLSKKQKSEYKEFRSEISQLKELFDELKDITQALIFKYQSDNIDKEV